MSLVLTFSARSGEVHTFGPAAQFCFEGETIRTRPGGEALAVHRSHAWEVDGRRFVRMDCSAPVEVRFLAADGARSQTFGPFVHLSCVDGVCYVDREVFAVVDRGHDDWYSIAAERHWPVMVVTPAG